MKIYKAVHYGQLEFETRNGWTMEQVLVHDHAVNIQHNAPAQVVNNASNNGYNTFGITVPVDSPVIVREPMFLLSKDDEVESRERQLEHLIANTQEQHKKNIAEYDALKRSHDTYKEEADRRTEEIGESIAVQRKLMTAKEKLEGDMGKVRKAIGDIRYFEIVGGSVPK